MVRKIRRFHVVYHFDRSDGLQVFVLSDVPETKCRYFVAAVDCGLASFDFLFSSRNHEECLDFIQSYYEVPIYELI